jgi:hypothetical protein
MTTEELLMKYENQWVFLSKEQIDYMLDEILPPLPQQEISDEEIEKGAKEWYNKEGAYSASAIISKTCN